MTIPELFIEGAVTLSAQPNGRGSVIPMTVSRSAMTLWCWAAVTVGVQQAFNQWTESQCEIANRLLRHNCCPTNPVCNIAQDLRRALAGHLAGAFSVQTNPGGATTANGVPILELVANEIATKGAPVCAGILLGAEEHFVAISGFWSDARGDFLYVWNPSYSGTQPIKWLLSEFIARSAGNWLWNFVYTTQRV